VENWRNQKKSAIQAIGPRLVVIMMVATGKSQKKTITIKKE
jgi:hypothetical protein